MDFTIPEELQMLQRTVRRFVQEELMPLEHSMGDEIPLEETHRLRQKAQGLGLFMMPVPQEFGGGGVSTLGMCLIYEETSQTIVDADYILGIDQPLNLLYVATPEQKEEYLLPVVRGEKYFGFALTEPGAGSDAAAIQTSALRQGDNYILNGTKLFISRMWIADFAIVFAVTDKEKGARGGITAFLVHKDTPGCQVVRLIETMAGRLSRGPTELWLSDCAVPATNVLGEVGQGFRLAQARLGAQRTALAARCIGASERALKMAVSYAKQRVTFGAPVAQRQGIQWMFADAAVELHAARLMTYHCAWKWDQGMEVRKEASIIKLFASEMACRIIDMAIQVHGGMGYSRDLPLERLYRRVRLHRIGEGPSEIHRNLIARFVLQEY